MQKTLLSLALTATFASSPVFAAGGVLFDNGAENTFSQTEISNTEGVGLEAIKGTSAKFEDSSRDISISGTQVATSSAAGQLSAFGAGIQAGEGGGAPAGSSVEISAKNITVSGASTLTGPGSSTYAVQVHGTDDEASVVRLNASENVLLTSTSKNAGDASNNFTVNNSNGCGDISISAGKKITLKSIAAKKESGGSYAAWVSSSATEHGVSSLRLTAKDIEAEGNGGLTATVSHSEIALDAENSNVIRAVGTTGIGLWAETFAVADDGHRASISLVARNGGNTVETAGSGPAVYAKSSEVGFDAGGFNALSSASGAVIFSDSSDVSLKTGGSNTVKAQGGMGVFAYGTGEVRLEAKDCNTVEAKQTGIYAGYADREPAAVKMKAGNNTVSSSEGIAVYVQNKSSAEIESEKRLSVSGATYGVSASSEGSAVMKAGEAEVTAKNALFAASGGLISLNAAEKLTLKGGGYAAFASGSGSSVRISAGGGSVYGNMYASDGGLLELTGSALAVSSNMYAQTPETGSADEVSELSVNLSRGSSLAGVVSDGAGGTGTSGVTKLRLDDSLWRVSGDSGVTELTSGGSTLDLASIGSYKRVTAGTFGGTGNTVKLRINLAEEKVSDDAEERKTDQLRLLKVSGDSANSVGIVLEKDTDDETKLHSANWLVKADEIAGSLKMSGETGKTVAADGSEKSWKLKFVQDPSKLGSMSGGELESLDDVSSGSGGEWYLVRSEETTEETETVEELGSSYDEYYAWIADLSDLRKRLGEVRSGAQQGGWVKVSYARYRADGIGEGSFSAKDYSVHAGLDRIVSKNENGSWLLGAAFRAGHTDMETNRGGSGDVSHYSGKIYGTYIGNSGFYTDFVGAAGYYDKEFSGLSNTGLQRVKADYSTWGAGVSAETGRKIGFGERVNADGSGSQWFAEPQIQLSYYWIRGKDYKTSTGMRVEQDDTHFLTGRIGAVFGRKFFESVSSPDRRYAQIAVRGGLMHEFLGEDRIRVNGRKYEGKVSGTALYYGLDFDWNFAGNHRVYVQLDRVHGSEYKKDVEVRAGYRYQF